LISLVFCVLCLFLIWGVGEGGIVIAMCYITILQVVRFAASLYWGFLRHWLKKRRNVVASYYGIMFVPNFMSFFPLFPVMFVFVLETENGRIDRQTDRQTDTHFSSLLWFRGRIRGNLNVFCSDVCGMNLDNMIGV
jgi:uncharacterized membrane protein